MGDKIQITKHSESTGVSEESHRLFCTAFVKACRANLYPKWVKRPKTDEEILDCRAEFTEAGFDGCIGSADVTHVNIEKCQARLKNQNLGGKSSHTTRAFQLVVNHRRQIIASTVGFNGRWNDKTVVRFNDFIKIIGIVGYWATSITTVRTTVLSNKVVKTDLFPDLDIAFRLLAFGCMSFASE